MSGGNDFSKRNTNLSSGKKIPGKKKKPFFSPLSLILLASVLLAYAVLLVIGDPRIADAGRTAYSILKQVVPVLLVVVLFMAGANLVPHSFVKRHLGEESGGKGYLVAVIAGMFSHGPVFAWYPFLSELKEKGVSDGKIAAFLYARAVKIPLLAAMIFYFGLGFTLLFSLLILLGAFLLGLFFERLFRSDGGFG